MDFNHILMKLRGTMSEANNIISRNRNLMAAISLVTILINSVLYLALVFSPKPFLDDLLVIGRSNPDHLAKLLVDLRRIAGPIIYLMFTFLVLDHLTFLLLNTTIIIVSAALAPASKYLFETLIMSLKRPFLTSVLVSMLAFGYLVILIAIIISFASSSSSTFFFTIICIFAYLLLIYLSVVWKMAIVVSVLEELHGLEALGKAEQLLKGMKLHGFVLRLGFVLVNLGLLLVGRAFQKYYFTPVAIVSSMIVNSCICLSGMYGRVAFTVFYYKCKNNRGEEDVVELPGRIDQYNKLSAGTTTIIDETIIDI